ncbi:hypothetical protein [Segeticoccus rhizosphaerae]|uniref:hypothetical protein n=1 Tax=Segeticoccus rhizosphaerae TaxID=1104777 RepID=UPI0012643C1A|nr:hypothetical protein [Segeticoccus rhizosphaerae]
MTEQLRISGTDEVAVYLPLLRAVHPHDAVVVPPASGRSLPVARDDLGDTGAERAGAARSVADTYRQHGAGRAIPSTGSGRPPVTGWTESSPS